MSGSVPKYGLRIIIGLVTALGVFATRLAVANACLIRRAGKKGLRSEDFPEQFIHSDHHPAALM